MINRTGRHGISRFSRMKVLHMPWFPDRAGPTNDSRKRRQQCCLPPHEQRGHPKLTFRGSIARPTHTPVQRFATPSRVVDAWLGAAVDRYSFGVELFHLLLHAGLSRRFLMIVSNFVTLFAYEVAHDL